MALADFLPPWPVDFASHAAAFAGLPHAGLECSGTASLVVILNTLKRLSPRRVEVVVPAYTCPLVVLAIAHCGLRTRLCDLAPESFELDSDALSAMCTQDTLAILPTHLAGRVAALGEVMSIARQQGAWVVEDAAQAFGARSEGQSVGLTGDAGFFSFAAGKGLSLYEGGLWTTKDAGLAREFARTHQDSVPRGILMELQRSLELAAYALLYRPRPLHWVYGAPLRRALRAGNLAEAVGDIFSPDIPIHRVSRWRQAAGSRALSRLADFHSITAAQGAARYTRLARLPGLRIARDAAGAEGVWPSLLLMLPNQALRDTVLDELWTAGLGVTRMFVSALPDYAYLAPWLTTPAEIPNARNFAARSLTLSNSPWLDEAAFTKILDCLERHLSRA